MAAEQDPGNSQSPDPSPYGPPAASVSSPAEQPPPPPDSPLFSRLLGVLTSPGATFKKIVERPGWKGPLYAYLAIVAVTMLVYSFRVDWEGMFRSQLEGSVAWKVMSSVLPEEGFAQAERQMLSAVTDIGPGGLTLQSVLQTLVGAIVGFHLIAILFATLLYLMGSLGDLKLGRVWLDGFLCVGAMLGIGVAGFIAQIPFATNPRAGIPVQAGISALTFVVYLWLFTRAVGRQPTFQRLIAVSSHALAVPMVGLLLTIIVLALQSEPTVLAANEILRSNLGALLGVRGTGAAAVFLGALDLFRLWELVAISVGFAALSGLSLGASISITFLPWGFITMVRVAVALVFGG